MAIPNNYIDKITNKDTGESRIISPAADMVRVGNENFEGADLDEVLDEVAQAIEDAGGGYEPPQGGIPRQDLEQSVQDSLELADSSLQPSDKTQLQGAITQLQNALNTLIGSGNVQGAIDTFNEVVAFLNGIDTDDPTLFNQLKSLSDAITALQTSLAGKISGIKANGASTTLPVDQNGVVELPPAASPISPATAAPLEDGTAGVGSSEKYAREDHRHPHDTSKLSKSDVSVETHGDGTVDIKVGEDIYTINLNHTHENMAKLVMCEETSLPASLDSNTIYAIVDDETEPMMIEKLVIRGLEFTGGVHDTGEPMVVIPADESTINLGTNSADGLTQTIQIKAKNLEDDLTVVVSGTGLSLSYGQQTGQSSVTIPVGSTGKVSTSVDIVLSGWGGTTGSLEFYIGQDLISAATIVAASDIPSEYTRLEYVNNATKGFLTGVDCVAGKEPFVGTTWELDVQGDTVSSTQILICSTWDTGHFLGESSGVSGYSMAGGIAFTTPSTTRGVVTVKFISLGLECTFNNETISRTSTTNFNHWPSSTGVIFKTSLLSDMNTANASANAMVFKGKVYSIKCTSGGNFNGVPAKRNSDNILGIYDKYSDTFYPITT